MNQDEFMTKEDVVKVQYSIRVQRTYSYDEVHDFIENNRLVSNEIAITLKQMIINDTVESIQSGKGTFRFL